MKWINFPALGLLGLLLLLFELGGRAQLWPNYILPLPSEIGLSAKENSELLWQASWETFSSALMGLGLAFLFATFSALIIYLLPILQKAILPFAVIFQTIPIVSIAPLLVIWFGFGKPTVVASSCIVSFFSIFIASLNGLTQVDESHLKLFQIYHASRWQSFIHLRLPASLPSLMTGLRIAAGLSVVGAIIGEFIAGTGLGSLIDSARTQQRLDLVFAAIIISTFVGFSFLQLISLGQRILLKRYILSE